MHNSIIFWHRLTWLDYIIITIRTKLSYCRSCIINNVFIFIQFRRGFTLSFWSLFSAASTAALPHLSLICFILLVLLRWACSLAPLILPPGLASVPSLTWLLAVGTPSLASCASSLAWTLSRITSSTTCFPLSVLTFTRLIHTPLLHTIDLSPSPSYTLTALHPLHLAPTHPIPTSPTPPSPPTSSPISPHFVITFTYTTSPSTYSCSFCLLLTPFPAPPYTSAFLPPVPSPIFLLYSRWRTFSPLSVAVECQAR